jgi:hypothetical protein
MLLMGYINIPIGFALGMIGVVLFLAIMASKVRAKRMKKKNTFSR